MASDVQVFRCEPTADKWEQFVWGSWSTVEFLFYFILFLFFFNEIRPCKKRKQKYLGLSERFPGRSCQNGGRTDVWSSSKPKPEKSVVSFCRDRWNKRLLETKKKLNQKSDPSSVVWQEEKQTFHNVVSHSVQQPDPPTPPVCLSVCPPVGSHMTTVTLRADRPVNAPLTQLPRQLTNFGENSLQQEKKTKMTKKRYKKCRTNRSLLLFLWGVFCFCFFLCVYCTPV